MTLPRRPRLAAGALAGAALLVLVGQPVLHPLRAEPTGDAPRANTSAEPRRPRLLFVGDSITLGRGAENPEIGGFVGRIAGRFPEFEIVNAACSGSTVRDWTNDTPSAHCSFSGAWPQRVGPAATAQLTHVMLGANDARGFHEIERGALPPEEYEDLLETLVDRAPGLILVSTPPPTPEPRRARRVSARLQGYRDAVRRIAERRAHVELGVDFYALLDPDTDLTGLHPTDAGHARMAEALEQRIRELLARRASESPP